MASRIDVRTCELREKLAAVLRGVGLMTQDAAIVSDALIDAEASGVESHGVTRLKPYVDRIVKGYVSPQPNIEIEEHGVTLAVDGGNGLGQVVMCKTVDRCLEIAKNYGVSIATVRRSNHFGTASYYANKLAVSGCIGFVATNAGATMAPFGGMDLLLGTNPFAVAFPAERQIFCADMATSAAAKGKIRIYAKECRQLPLGWALDANGNDTQDPEAAIKGILLPMSGHKGYALAMAVDAICGLLSGANLSCEAPSMFDTEIPANTGHFICAIDINHFVPLQEFESRAQQWFDKLTHSTLRPSMRVMIPGEPEEESRVTAHERLSILAESMDMVNEYVKEYRMH